MFASEPKCPFCGWSAPTRALASAVTLGAGLSLLACDRDAKTSAPTSITVPDATVGAPPVDAGASTETARADAGDGLGLGAIGDGSLRFGHSDAGLGLRWSAVYGPAQPSREVKGPKAVVELRGVKAGGVPDAERVLAGARARIRMACQMGLANDPALDGTLDFTLAVDDKGEVKSVDVKSKGLAPNVESAMKRALGNLAFGPPGKASKVTGTYTCKGDG